MTPRERRAFWAYAGVFLLITSLPYVIGFEVQGDDWVFSGFVFGVEDGNSYIAKMRLGMEGDWLFRTPYTVMAQRGTLAFLPYLILGKLASPPAAHLQLVSLFHLFRVAATLFALFATYRFMATFLEEAAWRLWATALATLGGGLGWMLLLIGRTFDGSQPPLEFISPETFGFLAYLGLPHIALGRGLLLLALRAYLVGASGSRKGWLGGLALLAAGLAQPLALVAGFVAIGAHHCLWLVVKGRAGIQAWRHRWLPVAVRTLLPGGLLAVVYAAWMVTDPFLQAWTVQNRIPSPPPVHYLLAYSLVLPWAVLGLRRAVRGDWARWALPWGWALAIPVLVYLPHTLQRRFPEGSWTALSLLAAAGLSGGWASGALKRLAAGLMLGLSSVAAAAILAGGAMAAGQPRQPVFEPQAKVKAFEWLEARAERGAVVLAGYQTGNALPAWAPVRVLIGHGPESAGLETVEPRVEAFFGPAPSNSERLSLLREFNITYVFFGPEERSLGVWDPASLAPLHLVYDEAGYEIYEVFSP